MFLRVYFILFVLVVGLLLAFLLVQQTSGYVGKICEVYSYLQTVTNNGLAAGVADWPNDIVVLRAVQLVARSVEVGLPLEGQSPV